MSNTWNTQLYDTKHAFVARYGEDVAALLDAQNGEAILDLGCGTGHLTSLIAQSGAQVIGLDESVPMLQTAREKYPHIEWVHADAREFSLPQRFDAVFTNAVLHWILPPERVTQRVWEHLKPGGRYVGEFGGVGNIAHLQKALREAASELALPPYDVPKYFPTPGQFAQLLENAGFEVRFLSLFDRPTPLEGADGLKNWYRQFCAGYLETLDETAREAVLERAQQKQGGKLQWEDGWFADYRRLRFVAVKPI